MKDNTNIRHKLIRLYLRQNQQSGFLLFIILFFLNISAYSQEVRQIDIIADIIELDSELGINTQRLYGNVLFEHEDVLMTCDSAYYFSDSNIVDAYSNVHLWQGDTLDLYGDFLKYNGNTKVANVRENVLLIDNENQLTTEYIDHYFNDNLAYYIGGGKIINGNNTLESRKGYYYTKEKLFFFNDSVVVTNPDYVMYSDTLKYNTVTEISYFLGPTDIISEENFIYCENGWYDTKNNISQFNKNAFLQNEGKTLIGDSLYYERETGLGKAYNNVELIDTAQNIVLKGNVAHYLEKTEYAMLTDSALMIFINEEKDSLFVHSDTLKSVPDTIPERRIIKAYYQVKFYREDLQGKSDSLVYSDTDSIFRFYRDPVIWSEDNQLTADYMEGHTLNNQIDRIEMVDNSFIITREDTTKFSQIKGRNMTGYIKDNELSRIEVNGNAETIYYAKDVEEIIGVNKLKSSKLSIYFLENKVNRIIYRSAPSGKYYPIEIFPESENKLEGFRWYEEYRPMQRSDVFQWIRK